MDPKERVSALLALILAMSLPCLAGAWDAPPAGGAADGQATAGDALPVDATMVLRGSLRVDAARGVGSYAIDQVDQVPPEVQAFLARQIADWRIDVAAGAELPPEAVLRFTVMVRASPAGDGLHRLWLDGVHVDEALPASQRVAIERRRLPTYPTAMARIGGSGVVYMLVLLDAQGRVDDVFAEQVDLTTLPARPEDVVQHQLEFIAHAAAAARQWRFSMPKEGPYAGKPLAVRVPVDFTMTERAQVPDYGQWQFLVRGVRRAPPWSEEAAGHAPEEGGVAIAGGDLQFARSRVRVVRPSAGADG